MQNNIQIFENENFGQIEVLMIDGKPHFPASECARILGYANPNAAVLRHCRGITKRDIPSASGIQSYNYIPEGDLYRLIIRSKLPTAILFEAWICDDVIPSIRQHGAYISTDTLDRMRQDNAFTEELLQRLSALQPKAQYFDNILQSETAIPVTVIAKDYGMTAIAFNKLLHDLGVQYKLGSVWFLYCQYADCGYTVTKTYYVGDKKVSVHTCWTQKGRAFLYDVLKYYGILPSVERFEEAV